MSIFKFISKISKHSLCPPTHANAADLHLHLPSESAIISSLLDFFKKKTEGQPTF